MGREGMLRGEQEEIRREVVILGGEEERMRGDEGQI